MSASTRRAFLVRTSATLAAAALERAARAEPAPPPVRGRAEHCVFVWLGGGMAQVDTFDPKRLGDPRKRIAGSAYEAIPTVVPGVHVCRFLPRVARLMDLVT